MAYRTSQCPAGWGFVAAFFAVLAGCSSEAEALFPVEGKVTYEGKLLSKGTVVLQPDASKGNTSQLEPRGHIEADGRFKIVTHPRLGAPAGWYKVAVIVTEPSNQQSPYAEPRWLIPEKFGKTSESQLSLEVRKDTPSGAYDLDLK